MVRALVFDFDGLIVDTEGPVHQAWREVFEEHGQRLSLSWWQALIGRASNFLDPLDELERLTGSEVDRERVTIARRVRERELVAAAPILPGVREWKDEAAAMGLPTAVASSSSRAWVNGHLARLGLGGWAAVRTREDVAEAKPAPDIYRLVAHDLGVDPAEALAVEDSPNGVAAARAAGLRCVAVPTPLTAGLDLSAADLRLATLDELSLGECLRRLEPG